MKDKRGYHRTRDYEANRGRGVEASPRKRAELASRLIVSLEERDLPAEEWEKLWVKECERRLAELREGRAEEVDGEEVFARAREILSP